MATAKEELEEVTGQASPPTIREALAEIGRDPAKTTPLSVGKTYTRLSHR